MALVLNRAHLVSRLADNSPREQHNMALALVLRLGSGYSEQHEVLHRLSCHIGLNLSNTTRGNEPKEHVSLVLFQFFGSESCHIDHLPR